jgi:hypothetical protein
VIVSTSVLDRSSHGVVTVTGKPALNATTQPSNGELTMKKIIFAAVAFASLTAMESTPAAAQYGCRTQFEGGRIVSVCNSPVGVNIGRPRNLPPVRCTQRPGFNQPYVCR